MSTTQLPAPQATSEGWQVRPDDASVLFRGKASRFAPTFAARFTAVTGVLSEQAVAVNVDVRSVTTGNRSWDELLCAADPFDVRRHPLASYRSERVHWQGDGAVVDGVLALRGRTAHVRLRASYTSVGDGLARLTATGRVDRRDFGLRLDVPGCGALVPTHLDLSIEVTAVRG